MQKGIISQVEEVSNEGKKTFYKVRLQDGAEMTAFDAKIKQAEAGDGLEFDVIIKGKFNNLKDGFIITKKASPVSSSKENGYSDMSKKDWEEKARKERASIETQVAAKIVAQLAVALPEDIWLAYLGGKADIPFTRLLEKTLAWCENKIDATIKPLVKPPSKATTKAKPTQIEPSDIEFDSSPVQSLGDLWTRCKNYSITKSEGLQIMKLDNQEQIADIDEAWKVIFEHKFVERKESEIALEPEDIPF